MSNNSIHCQICNDTGSIPGSAVMGRPTISCPCQSIKSPKVQAGIERLQMAMAHAQMTPGQRTYLAWHIKMGHENITEWHALADRERRAWEESARAAVAPLLTEDMAHAIDGLNKLLGQLLR